MDGVFCSGRSIQLGNVEPTAVPGSIVVTGVSVTGLGVGDEDGMETETGVGVGGADGFGVESGRGGRVVGTGVLLVAIDSLDPPGAKTTL